MLRVLASSTTSSQAVSLRLEAPHPVGGSFSASEPARHFRLQQRQRIATDGTTRRSTPMLTMCWPFIVGDTAAVPPAGLLG
jgi:hypothetical protein